MEFSYTYDPASFVLSQESISNINAQSKVIIDAIVKENKAKEAATAKEATNKSASTGGIVSDSTIYVLVAIVVVIFGITIYAKNSKNGTNRRKK